MPLTAIDVQYLVRLLVELWQVNQLVRLSVVIFPVTVFYQQYQPGFYYDLYFNITKSKCCGQNSTTVYFTLSSIISF